MAVRPPPNPSYLCLTASRVPSVSGVMYLPQRMNKGGHPSACSPRSSPPLHLGLGTCRSTFSLKNQEFAFSPCRIFIYSLISLLHLQAQLQTVPCSCAYCLCIYCCTFVTIGRALTDAADNAGDVSFDECMKLAQELKEFSRLPLSCRRYIDKKAILHQACEGMTGDQVSPIDSRAQPAGTRPSISW